MSKKMDLKITALVAVEEMTRAMTEAIWTAFYEGDTKSLKKLIRRAGSTERYAIELLAEES